jgi:HEAT repeat protein
MMQSRIGEMLRCWPRFAKAALLCAVAFGLATGSEGQADNVALQIAKLKDPNAAIRANAAGALGRFKDPRAVDPLIAVLNDEDPSVRMNAAIALGDLKDPRAVEPLIPLLKDPDKNVPMGAVLALGSINDPRAIPALIAIRPGHSYVDLALEKMGPTVVTQLLTALHDGDAGLRVGAAYSLGMLRDPRSVDPLIAALKDSDASVRAAACVGLGGGSYEPKALEPLIAALHDDDPKVRSMAARVLPRSKDPAVVAPLIGAMSDSDAGVRRDAAYALGTLGGHRAVEALAAVLEGNDETLRIVALGSLSRLHDPLAVKALLRAFTESTDRQIRIDAANGLGKQGDRAASDALIAALQDKDFGVRMSAAQALAEIKEPRAAVPLMAAMNDPSESNKQPYANALRSLRAPPFKDLIALLKDPATCSFAAGGLGASKDLRAVEPLIEMLKTPFLGTPHPYGGVPGGMVGMAAASSGTPKKSIESRPVCYLDIASALSAIGDPRAVAPLIEYMRTGPSGRDRVPDDLLHFGSPVVEPLIALLHDSNDKTRQLAADTLSRGCSPRGKEALLIALKEHNLAAISGAYEFYVSLGQQGSESDLVETLNRYGEQQMVEYFLNCGDVQLEDAARAWGAKHYPWMKEMPQQMYGVTWGKGQACWQNQPHI